MIRLRFLLTALLLTLAAASRVFADQSSEITADNILLQMNEERAQFGLAPLVLNERLAQAATDRMRDMEEGGWWSHESPEGRSPFIWLSVRDYNYEFAGENLAAGFETTRILVDSWMESPGHRDNILNANYQECGIAIIDGSTVRPAVGKSIVVMFGKRHGPSLRARAD
jgi:uncharacterized protein YkwD